MEPISVLWEKYKGALAVVSVANGRTLDSPGSSLPQGRQEQDPVEAAHGFRDHCDKQHPVDFMLAKRAGTGTCM